VKVSKVLVVEKNWAAKSEEPFKVSLNIQTNKTLDLVEYQLGIYQQGRLTVSGL